MRQKRALKIGVTALAMLASLGVLGFGCAGGGEETDATGGVPCVPEEELCGDKYDNDCDGQIDEGCECNPGDTQACYTGPEGSQGKGTCAGGEQTCSMKGKWGDCQGEVLPAAGDTCDGIDNDCDGMIDPGCECSPPGPETKRDCYMGPAGTEGVGDCTPGFQICLSDGTWDSECIDEVHPSEEKCDGFDNDCDNEIDDMGMTTCGVGACQVSVITCTNGALTPCFAKAPSKEVCDGADNDCDQLTDESDPDAGKTCDSGLLGACAVGKIACSNGAKSCVPSVQATPEKCDGADNDCDGMVDDNIPGTGGSCSTGFPGVCSAGEIQCQNNVIDCYPIIPQSAETCDGTDNDCDGQTDELNPGGGVVCSTGKPGVCASGKTNCVNGVLECTPNVAAAPELCNNQIDDNCDGQIDESAPEQCDGIDNDCNGVIDNGNPGGGQPCATGQPGACAGGLTFCEGAQFVCKFSGVLFSDDFSKGNVKGWTLGPEWAIGPTATSTGHSTGYGDPANDHTPTEDNNVAGVILGGNASTALHSAYHYLTSPVIDVSGAPAVHLEFWRWLNSDYTPFMNNVIEVFNGSTWVMVWQSGSTAVQDNAWKKQSYDVSGYKNPQFQFRIGFNVNSSGVWTMAQWNVDDVVLTTASGCQ
jgi:hypothetical protein